MIKNLSVDDIPIIMVIGESAFGHVYNNEETFQDRIETFPEGCLGFFQENNLIAFTTTEIWSEINKIEYNSKASVNHDKNGYMLYVSDMAVLPVYQGKNIGSELIKELINLAKKLDLGSIYLGSSKAKGFYEKNGFTFLKRVADDGHPYDLMEFRLSKL
ncbi:MAG: GNAT family N-acetyltransferase [archaeon]